MPLPPDASDPGGWTAATSTTTGPTGGGDGSNGAPLAPDDRFQAALAAALAPSLAVARELEGGGMARVFVAREVALGRPVVVKVLPPDLAAGVNRERFRREIQLAAALQHPHIVPLLAAGEIPGAAGGAGDAAAAAGSLYYTMPFIEGESLRVEAATRSARGQAFAPREVLRILRDVVGALGYAHARGVVHRDVKPGNVLLASGHALVTDFGVAKALAASLPVSVHTVTTLGMAVGTPAYMAPEQLAADPAADHRVDLYAAGLVAYELLSGASPFASPSPQATLAAQLTRVPEPIAELRPDVPPALAAVVMQCLAKDPAARPASAAELLAALDAADGGGPAVAPAVTPTFAPNVALATAPAVTVPTTASAPASFAPAAPAAPAQAAGVMPNGSPRAPARRRRAAIAAGALTTLAAGGVWVAVAGRGTAPSGGDAGAPARAAAVTPAAAAVAAAPSLSRADSIAIASAVAREFERAAARAGAVAAAQAGTANAAAKTSAAPPTDAADSARLRRAARNVVADSLARIGQWGHMSRDVVRAVVGRLPVELPRGLPPGVPPEERRAVDEALRRAHDEMRAAGLPFGGGAPPDAPEPPPPPGAPAPERTPWPGFTAVTAGLPAPAPGVRRAVLVAALDETGRPELARLAPVFDAALRARLRAAGPFDVTGAAVAATARREGVPDAVIVRATGADAVLRTVLRASGGEVRATLFVRGARGGGPAVVEARAPADKAANAAALAEALAEPLARGAAGALGGGRGGEGP